MTIFKNLLALIVIGSCGTLLAAEPAGYTPMKIIETAQPTFPYQMQQKGYDSGMVRVLIKVDQEGRLVEQLLTAYTHREFANSALAALKRWRFEPARQNDVARPSMREVVVSFERKGISIGTLDSSDVTNARFSELASAANEYRAREMRELDGIPTPTKIVPPEYAEQLAARGITGRVTVEFYIDEEGRVRMPSVTTPGDDLLSDAAIDAVTQWTFTPPTSRGRPVLVRASQTFNFERPTPGVTKS